LPLRIAFDLDGVLADMESELVRQTETLFGASTSDAPDQEGRPADSEVDVALPDVPKLERVSITARQEHQLWRHVATIDGFWESLDEIEPGQVARLGELARAHRWEVIFLTRRPESAGATAQVQTQRWLAAHGFPLPSVFVAKGSRGLIAAALGLDVVVDDRPENCVDVAVDSKARPVLVWRNDPETLRIATRRLGIAVVSSVHECLTILSDAEGAGRDRSGLIERVMRRLGLKEPVDTWTGR
jgi:hypothetical protein